MSKCWLYMTYNLLKYMFLHQFKRNIKRLRNTSKKLRNWQILLYANACENLCSVHPLGVTYEFETILQTPLSWGFRADVRGMPLFTGLWHGVCSTGVQRCSGYRASLQHILEPVATQFSVHLVLRVCHSTFMMGAEENKGNISCAFKNCGSGCYEHHSITVLSENQGIAHLPL